MKKFFIRMNIKCVFMVIKVVFLSGWKCIMFKLVGIYKVFWYLLNFIICMLLIDIFVVLCSMLNRLMCRWWVKCLLISFRVGIWFWMIWFWEEKLKFVVLGLDLGNFFFFLLMLLMLWSSVLILFWFNKLVIFYLLYYKVGK